MNFLQGFDVPVKCFLRSISMLCSGICNIRNKKPIPDRTFFHPRVQGGGGFLLVSHLSSFSGFEM